jgi:diguanylate cyclase (GGDEF)-like protein
MMDAKLRASEQDMSEPLQILSTAQPLPDLGTSPFGPFVVHPAADLDAVGELMATQTYDAILLQFANAADLARLAAWPSLSRAVLDTAVLVVAPEPAAADAMRLVQVGVQDVIRSRDASAERLACAARLAVERKRVDSATRNAYSTDLGTGLPNHAQLMEHMTHLLALREREPAAMALLALRVEGLTTAEAQLGAEAANVLRRKVAVRLRSGLRASDVVASIGADSFAVLLAWIEDPADGDRVGAKLVQLLRRPFSVTGQDISVSVTVGIGQYPAHGKEAAGLLHRALAQAAGMASIGRGGIASYAEGSSRAAANDGGSQ